MTQEEAVRPFMYGKIHRCKVTGADLHYNGSITVDPLLLRAARIYPYTRVDVVNISNGNRLQTYVIDGPEGGGDICLNGAAAHLFKRGDLAIIMAYESCPVSQLPERISRAVLVDGENRVVEVAEYVTPDINGIGRTNRLGERYETA